MSGLWWLIVVYEWFMVVDNGQLNWIYQCELSMEPKLEVPTIFLVYF